MNILQDTWEGNEYSVKTPRPDKIPQDKESLSHPAGAMPRLVSLLSLPNARGPHEPCHQGSSGQLPLVLGSHPANVSKAPFIKIYFIVFFSLKCIPLLPSSTPSHPRSQHAVVGVHEFFLVCHFCSSLHPLLSPPQSWQPAVFSFLPCSSHIQVQCEPVYLMTSACWSFCYHLYRAGWDSECKIHLLHIQLRKMASEGGDSQPLGA